MQTSLLRSPTDAAERAWLRAIVVLHLLLISLPYLWAALTVPDGQVWGGLLFNLDDQNVHLSWAKQAQQGHFFFRDLFTTENLTDGTRPLFTNLLAWLMGVLSHLVPLIWVYHGLRLLFAYLALRWFWQLCAQLTDGQPAEQARRTRLLAVAIAAFGGGFGWIRTVVPGLFYDRQFIDRPAENFPMMPEAFGFTSAFIFTLNIVAMALLAFIFSRVLWAQQTGERKAMLFAAVAALLLANIHTYDAIPLIVTLAVWLVVSVLLIKQQLKLPQEGVAPHIARSMLWQAPLAAMIGATLPVLYQVIVFSRSEEFRLKALTPTLPPPVLDLALSYGPWFLLALAGIYQMRHLKNEGLPQAPLMLLWAGVTFTVVYLPVSFGRKMLEGVHLPLAFLAALSLSALLGTVAASLRRLLAGAAVMLLSISSLYFIHWCININWRDNNLTRGPLTSPLRLSTGDMQALQFLDRLPREQKAGSAVLAFTKLSNYVPRETGLHSYVGHWAETLHRDRKMFEMARFYQGQIDNENALQWLRANRIRFVIEGEYERGIFEKTLPSSSLGLQMIHNENGTAIYAVP